MPDLGIQTSTANVDTTSVYDTPADLDARVRKSGFPVKFLVAAVAVAALAAATGYAPSYARTRATPMPVPSSTPDTRVAPAPARVPTSDSIATPSTEAPTPIPTAKPTPRPIAPEQPTVPDSIDDPTVRGIIARPIRELGQFGWLVGTWHAHDVEEHADGTSRDRGLTTYVFGTTMKGRYIFGADGKASDYLYVTFDPFARHWVLVRFEENPSYGIWISETGWQGNRIEFLSNVSYANGRQYRRRLTIIHKDARTFGIYDEEQLPNGSWTPDDAVELTRQR